MKRLIAIAVALIVALGFAAPHVDVNFMRPRIERSIQRGLGRRVEVSKVYINLFTGPGFTVEGVTIHEDPRAGIEPFVYVRTLEARVRLLSLFSRRLEFSSLRMADDANINLVKTDAGPWNFQFLLGAAPTSGATPAINMRGGRINFKFGDSKSVFYFTDADLDVSPSGDGSVDLRFSGTPSRTDQGYQNFGHFFVRGKWSGQQLDMRVELEPSALEEVARLFDQHGFGLHGIVALDAQLSGPPSKLDVAGTLRVDDVHRWDLLPKRGGGWSTAYKGSLDLRGERLEVASTSEVPNPLLGLQFRAWDFLSAPRWEAAAALNTVPLATLVEVARHMGAPLVEKLAAEGSVSGSVRYSQPGGLDGDAELRDASVTLPDAQPLHAAEASVAIHANGLSLDSTTVRIGEDESADVEGTFSAGAGLDLRLTTRSLSVADLRSFGLSAIPLLEQTPQGNWRGWARYRWISGRPGEWTGEYELQNARIAMDGFAAPLRIQSASVISSAERVSVSRLRAKIGEIALTGEYRWEPAAVRPHRFKLSIPKADAIELERLLAPALIRERGFLARTLRLGPAPVPAWLAARGADGTLSIESLALGDARVRVENVRILWDGASIRLLHLNARAEQGAMNGDLAIDLSSRVPQYRFQGKFRDVAYKGGQLDFDGNFETEGTGIELIAAARGEGSLKARSILFAPDTEFRSASGCFEILPGPRLKLSCLEVSQGGETLSGSGATQTDGRLVLDLLNRGRQVRYTASMTPVPNAQ